MVMPLPFTVQPTSHSLRLNQDTWSFNSPAVSWLIFRLFVRKKKQEQNNYRLFLIGPDGDYFVLDTDYVTYTAVYDCVNVGAFKLEYAWLMSRTNTLTAEQLATARAAYTQFGIDISTFEATYQSDSCVYLP